MRRAQQVSALVIGLATAVLVRAEPVGLPPDFWSNVSMQVQIAPVGEAGSAQDLDPTWADRSSGSGFRLVGPLTTQAVDGSGNLLGTFTLGNESGGGFWFDPDPVMAIAASAVNYSSVPLLYSFSFNMPLVPSLTGLVDSYAELGVTLTDSGGSDGAYVRPLFAGGDLLSSFDIDADGWAISKNVDIGSAVNVAAGAVPGTAQQIFWQSGSLICEATCVTMSATLIFILSPGDAVGFSGRVEQVAAVPLPAGIWLLGSGLLGLAGLRRRRRA